MSLLLASNAWILDVVFFAILLIAMVVGIVRGFIRGICKLAGTLFSVIVAFFFCTPLTGGLEETFGLVTKLGDAIGSASVAYWLMVAASFVVLVILTKLVALLLGNIGKRLVETSNAINAIDKVLGAVLSVAEALLFVLFIMAICKWIQIDVVEAFLKETRVVGPIYFGEWFEWLAGLPARFIQGGKDAISLIGMMV